MSLEANERTALQEHWAEHPDQALPEGFLAFAEGESVSPELARLKVRMSTQPYPTGEPTHFHANLGDTLHEVFVKASHALDKGLLPPLPAAPLDLLRLKRHGHWGEPLTDLNIPLWVALAEGYSRHASIEYLRVVQINTKWGVPSQEHLTPRALLTEFGFDPQEFSLYREDSNQPLPPETTIELKRGDRFEAQKDGRYGGASSPSLFVRGTQTIEEDVQRLRDEGLEAVLQITGSQKYVEIRGLKIPSPPWSQVTANILISIPATYPIGGLDALYLEQGVNRSGAVPNQQSSAALLGRTWLLISWHYATNRPWKPNVDDLGTHVEHCRGYFLARGVSQ